MSKYKGKHGGKKGQKIRAWVDPPLYKGQHGGKRPRPPWRMRSTERPRTKLRPSSFKTVSMMNIESYEYRSVILSPTYYMLHVLGEL